jgi:hypothetical protein
MSTNPRNLLIAALLGGLSVGDGVPMSRPKWVKSGKGWHHTKKGPGRRHRQGALP